jgi:hypothetical protein
MKLQKSMRAMIQKRLLAAAVTSQGLDDLFNELDEKKANKAMNRDLPRSP